MKSRMTIPLTMLMGLLMWNPRADANNIAVTNVSLQPGGSGYVMVQFDVSWDHSWRGDWVEGTSCVTNWDAAWVFVKFRYGTGANWYHASLGTNNSYHSAPAGSTVSVGLTDTNCVGVFFHRSETGHGSWTNTVSLRWNYAQDGVANTAIVDVCVNAIEMVYVAQGSFALGSGGTEAGHFYKHPTTTDTYPVTNEDAIAVGATSGYLNYTTGGNYGDGAGPVPAAFPKGYAAFYCMKYEISQGQYADFLNQLTSGQASTRAYTSSGYRHTITGSHPAYTAAAPDRACNNISWADGVAYADWAGLRPMTELEYEKACRGLAGAVADEYAWANATAPTQIAGEYNDGLGTSTANPSSAKCCYDAQLQGPCRVGIFATTNSTRQAAGATYWGIMEMCGNVYERPVTVGNATGRTFTGLHGNGVLTSGGNADVSNWPAYSTAIGAGIRGGAWGNGAADVRVSVRINAANSLPDRNHSTGWRGVRLAP